jgi:hypothetical protein
VQVLLVSSQIDYGVTHELTRAVKGDVTTPLDLVHLDSSRGQGAAGEMEVSLLRRSPERDHRWMLDQQQEILRQLAGDPRSRQLALELQDLVVRPVAQRGDV